MGIAPDIDIGGGRRLALRVAGAGDIRPLQDLYYEVYGGSYTLTEVTDEFRMRSVISDPKFLWLVTEIEGRLVGSVVFVIDPPQRMGKTFAGVVHPDFRGSRIMTHIIREGIRFLCEERGEVDLVYAVVRTFISPSVHQELRDLGFVDLGIFPNVRKVERYETHGLKVYFTPKALEERRRDPLLIPQANVIYEVTRRKLHLEPARVEDVRFARRLPDEASMAFAVEEAAGVAADYEACRSEGSMVCDFFPFHMPEAKLVSKDGRTEMFVHLQPRDGHASILGIRTEEDADVTSLLRQAAEYCENQGVKYLELLVPAYDPSLQRKAYDAGFLPCAYFPAAKRGADGLRADYVVTANSFVPPYFRDLRLTEDTRDYMKAYFEVYTGKLREDLADA